MSPTATSEADRWALTSGDAFRVLRYGGCPRGSDTLLLVHHGLGEHAGRYEQWVADLDLGLVAMGFDLRGHGLSAGERGVAQGLDQLVRDVDELLPRFLDASGCSRVLIYAHSLGGAVVARYLTSGRHHEAIQGVVFSAPAVAVQRTLTVRVQALAGRVLRRLAPGVVLPSGLAADGISSDPGQVRAYLDDPLIHDRLGVSLGMSLLKEGPEAVEHAGRATVPAFLVHGEDDPIIPLAGARDLASRWGARSELRSFPGGRHELHHERPSLRGEVRVAVREGVQALLGEG